MEHGHWVAVVRVEEVQQVTDEVGFGGFDMLDHAADFLKRIQGFNRKRSAVPVRAFWIVETVGGFVAGGIVSGDAARSARSFRRSRRSGGRVRAVMGIVRYAHNVPKKNTDSKANV